MLSQVNLWAERVGMVLDLVLMLRILTLKLRTTYLFITLFALLNVFYDGVELVVGSKTEEFRTVEIFSRFIYAVVFPLAAWEVFEEAKPFVEQIRRSAMSRMISSLLFITLWGLIIAAFTGGEDSDQSHYLLRVALIIWTGSVAAALAFLWVMKRGIRAGSLELPWNTAIWLRFFWLLLVIEAVSCMVDLVWPLLQSLGTPVLNQLSPIIQLTLQVCEIALTIWCVYKLRSVPSDASNVPVAAG
jgi:hypothetical protein